MPIRTIITVPGTSPAAARRWWWAGLLLCLAMLALHMVAGMNSAGVADLWRDMYWATSIAHGERFPLAGPQIYQVFELGPWWFYLLALPMGLSGSVALTAAFAQALAAAKYLLAWRLGLRIAGERFGFALAAATVVGGWSMLPLMFPSHTALVETALLLLVFATWRGWNRWGAGDALLFGLACVACVHAHPTTLVPVVLAALVVLWRQRTPAAWIWMALAVVIVLASLLPPWIHRDPGSVASLKPVPTYVTEDLGVDPLARVPGVLRAIVVGGAWWGLLLMTKWSAAAASIGWWLYCACLLGAGAGLLRLRGHEYAFLFRLGLVALAVFFMQVAFLVLVRPITPMWMVASCLPPLSLAVALGWYGWLADRRALVRRVAGAALGLQLVLALVPYSIWLRDIVSVRVMPGVNPFLDVIESSDGFVTVPVPFYPLRRLDALASELCGRAVLHGRIAALVEAAFATPLRNACGRWPELRYGGVEGAGTHVVGLLPRMAAATGITPTREVAGMAMYEDVRAVAPVLGGRSGALRRLQINPDSGTGVVHELVFEFESRGADVVVLTNRMPYHAPMERRLVEAAGHRALMLGEDGSSYAYACAACDPAAPLHWRIVVKGIAANLDLVVLVAR